MRYGIGLDVGITSVGYSVLEIGDNDMPVRIDRLGARIFDVAENPKNGDSLAKPRREKRSMRRRLRRKRHRLERIKGLIVSQNILAKEDLASLYNGNLSDIYELRTKALDESITNDEFARILINLAQRRGFKSNRKNANSGSDEDGKLLEAVKENEQLCSENGYRTVGEMLFKDPKFKDTKRNKSNDYKNTVSRDSVEKEAKLIFESQRKYDKEFASVEIEKRYTDILLSQRSFADGPGSGPYSGNQVERMRGKCTFEAGEPRAAKASYSFQIFSLWQEINHLRIIQNGSTIRLNDAQRHEIFNLAHQKDGITYGNIRKALNLSDEESFVGLSYGKKGKSEVESKKKIKALSFYHLLRKNLNKISKDYISYFDTEKLDAIGEALSKNLSDDDIKEELIKANVPEEAIDVIIEMPDQSKFGHISVKACRKIIPFLESGLTYDKACSEAGYNFKNDEKAPKFTLPPVVDDDSITSPVVKRAISQTIKVINAIIREYDRSPVYINLELAREMALVKKERDEIHKAQLENADANEKAMDELKTQLGEYFAGRAPSGLDLVKFKLWKQQDGVCPYSQQRIEISRLLELGYVDVDHIVPYSKCFDDRMANKVLVFTSENRQKGNRLPLEYMSGEKRDRFEIWVNSQDSIPVSKKNRLLMEHISDEKEWKERNLVDTQFTSAFLNKYISENLAFDEFETGKKRHVTCVNGSVTAFIRKRWGINKVRANGDLHHAMDATVIACITQGLIQKVTNYSKYHECRESTECEAVDLETGEIIKEIKGFPEPWNGFRNELEIRLNDNPEKMHKMLYEWDPDNYRNVDIEQVKPVFVSRMCNHKVSGPAHKETAKSGILAEDNLTVSKVDIKKLKLDKDGEIVGYYNPDSDRLLYEALKEQLHKYNGKAESAFAETFYKPKSNGEKGPVVNKVKIVESASSGVKIQGGTAIADNDSMVRCDVFYVEGDGYYFVPIYVADTVSKQLPNRAPTRSFDEKGNKIWKLMDDKYFVFSVRKNDLLKITSSQKFDLINNLKESTLPEVLSFSAASGVFLYYDGLDISTSTFAGITHDNTYRKRGMGKTLLKIEKYEVDVLGNIRKVEKEKRQTFKH